MLLTKHFLDYSNVVQPGHYLEKEKEERNDSEKTTHVEQSAGKKNTETSKIKLSC